MDRSLHKKFFIAKDLNHKMDKRVIIGILSLAVILFGLWLIFSWSTKNVSLTEYCQEQKTPSIVCTQILVDKGILDSSACENFTDNKFKDACFYYAARNNKDISSCEKINDGEWLNFCKTVLEKNPSLCTSLKSEKLGDYWEKNCYEDLAKINNDLSLCDNFSGTYRYVDCYQGVASYHENIKICERLLDKDQINQCKFQYNNLEEGY